MPAEKLTRARLTQILVMMGILLIAFFWRTFDYYSEQAESPKVGVSVKADIVECNVKIDLCQSEDKLWALKIKDVNKDDVFIVELYSSQKNIADTPQVKSAENNIELTKIDSDHFYWQFEILKSSMPVTISVFVSQTEYPFMISQK
ncbi:hypothetical protein [Thaumasiovibrio subtropicus]|uniref:hypothetical protein n=1 Tax=Thaumasiovibrio subtropicus TaxID=1891207 RepID=UPI000B358A27|nr:hypothetical protein [Thaumasiovibrio subtropicus]